MEITTLLQYLLALLLVIAMMAALALILKLISGGRHMPLKKEKRLKIVEILPLDHKRRAILIQRDSQEHLLVLGHNSEIVVETNIKIVQTEAEKYDM